jgi:single-strand DNA-binding protein
MPNLNCVFLMGNLTRDPEVRYTPSGTAVAQFGLATNRRWKDRQSGEMREEATFVDVEMWGRQAELVGQYLSKGRPVFVEGRLRLDQWDDRNTGQKRSRLKVVGRRFEFLGGRPDGVGRGAPTRRPASAQEASGSDLEENFEASEDIPF